MSSVCRLGDTVTGTCTVTAPGHPRTFTGTWTTCSGLVVANNIGVIRVGDTGITDCGHHFKATTGSAIGDDRGIALVRVGDSVVITDPGGGTGTTVTGSPNIFCN